MNEIHKKVWGHEKWLFNTPNYCSKILYLNKDYRCSMHHHKIKDETFYILKGLVLMEKNGDSIKMKVGDSIHISPNDEHRFTGLLDSEILEVSTEHYESDSYRSTTSEKVP